MGDRLVGADFLWRMLHTVCSQVAFSVKVPRCQEFPRLYGPVEVEVNSQGYVDPMMFMDMNFWESALLQERWETWRTQQTVPWLMHSLARCTLAELVCFVLLQDDVSVARHCALTIVQQAAVHTETVLPMVATYDLQHGTDHDLSPTYKRQLVHDVVVKHKAALPCRTC
eukprot:8716506-Alexandrium_andersonii.AAC.1